jgi:hypothetical protein
LRHGDADLALRGLSEFMRLQLREPLAAGAFAAGSSKERAHLVFESALQN